MFSIANATLAYFELVAIYLQDQAPDACLETIENAIAKAAGYSSRSALLADLKSGPVSAKLDACSFVTAMQQCGFQVDANAFSSAMLEVFADQRRAEQVLGFVSLDSFVDFEVCI